MIPLPRSIAGRLLFWQITGVTVILLALGGFFYSELQQIVVTSVDNTLHAKAQIFTGLLHEEHGNVELELSDIIAGEYVIPRSGHYYRVMKGDSLLAASPSLVDVNFSFAPNVVVSDSEGSFERYVSAVGPAGEPVRVLQYHYRAFGSIFEITLAESLASGLAMVGTFRHFLLIALPLGILVLCITAWWITHTALAPLSRFSTIIESITHRNMDERLDTDRTAREVTRLASSFNAMLDRLHHVFESQKRLVADASHELKTPLAVLRTQCDVTLQKERSPADYAEAIHTIREGTRNITRIVNDLLSLARLDAGTVASMNFVPVNVRELVCHAVRLTELMANRQNVRVTVAVENNIQVLGTRPSLEEALLNLVENAIRYNHTGGEVHITASQKANGGVAIEVADTGIGIDLADQERIFERFYRATAVRNREGSGLGLSIVKAIVDAHQGTISVVSTPGQGTCFTLLLPEPVDASSK